MRIAITGAAGEVGRQALDALDDHDVTPITHREHDDIDSRVVEMTDREAFADAVAGHDALVHLAWAPSPADEWDDVDETDLFGVYAAYEAAVAGDLARVVFASSNHAANMVNVADPSDPETTVPDPEVVDPDDPPRPDSYYGVTKVAGEAMGSYYADRYGIEVVNLRIGWLMPADELRDEQDGPPDRARFARATWLSPRDCRDVLRGAVTASLPETSVTLNAVSRNDDRFFSLTPTLRAVGYRPRDNSAEAIERADDA